MRTMTRAALLLTVAIAGGCDEGTWVADGGPESDAALALDGATPTDAGAPVGSLEVELRGGSGPLPDGSLIEAYAGPQGGFHVFVGAGARGVGGAELSGRVELHFEAFGPGDEVLADIVFGPNVRTGVLDVSGLLLELDVPSLDALRGITLRVSATVRDPSGLEGTDEHEWIVTAP